MSTAKTFKLVGPHTTSSTVVAENADGIFVVGPAKPARREMEVCLRACLRDLGVTGIVRAEAGQDLAAAIALLVNAGRMTQEDADRFTWLGQLGLDGRIKPVRGLFGFSRDTTVVAAPCSDLAPGSFTATSIQDVLNGDLLPHKPTPNPMQDVCDFRELSGPYWEPILAEFVKAVRAGARVIHLEGPPGSGRVALARRVMSLFDATDRSERYRSIAGLSSIGRAPFRAPHHTASERALLGSQDHLGELALSTDGVLLLDDITEFRVSTQRAIDAALREGSSHGWDVAPRLVLITSSPGDRRERIGIKADAVIQMGINTSQALGGGKTSQQIREELAQ